jgi:aspartate racemase
MTEQIVGIVGGMGPAATVELYRRLTEAVPARVDQDHPRVLIDSHSRIPDRTLALISGGEDPVPYLLDSIRRLEGAGADVLIMPCNTAHAYLTVLQDAADSPILDMIDLSARALAAKVTKSDNVALVATDGTVQVGIYQRAAAAHGVDLLLPEPEEQAWLMEAIGLVKASEIAAAHALFAQAVGSLETQGASHLLLGCTELSVLATAYPPSISSLDPLDVLVAATLAWLGITPRPLRSSTLVR